MSVNIAYFFVYKTKSNIASKFYVGREHSSLQISTKASDIYAQLYEFYAKHVIHKRFSCMHHFAQIPFFIFIYFLNMYTDV